MIKEVIFDCFGVLTQDGWLAFLGKYATDETIEELRYLNHQADRALITYQEFIDEVARITEVDKATAHSMITTNHQPNEDVFTIIAQLSKHYQIGVISNVGGELSSFLPQEYLKNFRHQTLSYKVGWLKPESQIYLEHLKLSGTKPEETLFIDDRQSNVDGARALGMEAVLFTDTKKLKDDLHSFGLKF